MTKFAVRKRQHFGSISDFAWDWAKSYKFVCLFQYSWVLISYVIARFDIASTNKYKHQFAKYFIYTYTACIHETHTNTNTTNALWLTLKY